METYEQNSRNKVIRGSQRARYSKSEVFEIIDSGFIGFLSFKYDEEVICLPMAYARIENKIYVHGSLKNRMLLSIIDTGKANMMIMHLDGLVLAKSAFHHSVNYRSVSIFGSAKIVEDQQVKHKALVAIIDYMTPDRWNHLRPMNDKEFNATLVVEIDIESASAKVRAAGPVEDKNDEELAIWSGIIPVKHQFQTPVAADLYSRQAPIPLHVTELVEKANNA